MKWKKNKKNRKYKKMIKISKKIKYMELIIMRGRCTRAQMLLKTIGLRYSTMAKKMGFLAQKRPQIFYFLIGAFTSDTPPPLYYVIIYNLEL
jgi:hypothetical protein